jgi:hypothetical protein
MKRKKVVTWEPVENRHLEASELFVNGEDRDNPEPELTVNGFGEFLQCCKKHKLDPDNPDHAELTHCSLNGETRLLDSPGSFTFGEDEDEFEGSYFGVNSGHEDEDRFLEAPEMVFNAKDRDERPRRRRR